VRLEVLTAMLTQISALLGCYAVSAGVNSRILEFSVQNLSQFDSTDIPVSVKNSRKHTVAGRMHSNYVI
jgi:hypothetical protein